MDNKTRLDRDSDIFSAKRKQEIIILRFKENPFLRAADLRAKAAVLNYLDLVSRTDSIKAVVILGSPRDADSKEYVEFFQQVSEGNLDQSVVERIQNAVDQLVLSIVGLNKIVIHVDTRECISLLLNIGLACDYRIVSDNSVFQSLHLELGLVPKGGSAFFLSKMLGISKACEVLLSVEDISAQEALRLGIVNEIVPSEKLEETGLKIAQRFAQNASTSLSGIKRLLHYPMKELGGYLEFENEELFRIIHSFDFRKKLQEWNVNGN